MAAPCVLVSSCSNVSPKILVQQISQSDELSSATCVVDGVEGYPWHIDTKYYTAEVLLCTTTDRTIGNKQFADSVQAFIVHFDSQKSSSFEQVKTWLPFLKELEPVVQLLVCDKCTQVDGKNSRIPAEPSPNGYELGNLSILYEASPDNEPLKKIKVSKQDLWSWCLEHSFEMIELSPEEDSDSEEDDFQETLGVERIIQALHAHSWPNLILKDRPEYRSSLMTQLMKDEAAERLEQAAEEKQSENQTQDQKVAAHSADPVSSISSTLQQDSVDSCTQCLVEQATSGSAMANPSMADQNHVTENQAKDEDTSIDKEDMKLLSALGNEDPNEESFEQLFDNLRLMKEKAGAMPLEERKAYAEKVAVSFWRAIGGDADEIAGLSTGSESD